MALTEEKLDLLKEKLIKLTAVPPILPIPATRHSVWRWTDVGLCGVRLETVKIGRVLYTSEPAVQRFLDRITVVNSYEAPAA